jgi:hypothetical protein
VAVNVGGRDVAAHKIGGLEKIVQRRHRRPPHGDAHLVGDDARVVEDDVHAHGLAELAHLPANGPQAQDAQAFALELEAVDVVLLPDGLVHLAHGIK